MLAKVKNYVRNQFMDELEKELKSYWRRRYELSSHDGCLLWRSRMIVPPSVWDILVRELHETHPGVFQMKGLYLWWPSMDSEIKTLVKISDICQSQHHSPPVSPLHPWEWPEEPWYCIHIAYVGPFLWNMFLVLVDTYSKSTSQITIEKMSQTIANMGLSKMVVSDIDTAFTSSEFQDFRKLNGIIHRRSAPYHPSSSGLAVQSLNEGLNKITGSIEFHLNMFLFRYRIMRPHSVTGRIPSELIFVRTLRSQLNLLFPDPSLLAKYVKSENNRNGIIMFMLFHESLLWVIQ